MPIPQQWPHCDPDLHRYVQGFAGLLADKLAGRLVGVYLHGSLAMGCYYAPKSDLDVLVVVSGPLPPALAEETALAIAQYSARRPPSGELEVSVITSAAAREVPERIPYLLHYSSSWRERILRREVDYEIQRFDVDLSAHLLVVKQRGACLCGAPIEQVFGDVRWEDFLYAVLDDLAGILRSELLGDPPYYGVLNACRVLMLLMDGERAAYSKREGGLWALRRLPQEHRPLIRRALEAYASPLPAEQEELDPGALRAFREEVIRLVLSLLPPGKGRSLFTPGLDG